MQPQKGENSDSTNARRVTDEQAAVFAAYEKDGKVWYELDASLTAPREDTSEGMAEFEWLRDLALDPLLARRERDEAQAHAERLKADVFFLDARPPACRQRGAERGR
jgi:hypothetical protein